MTVLSVNPYRPTEVVAEVPAAGEIDVVRAAKKARIAQREWWATLPTARAETLTGAAQALADVRDTLADLITREVGKPRRESLAEVNRAVALLRYFAQQTLDPMGEVLPAAQSATLLLTQRRPRGIAGLITPWNFPLAIPLWKAAPALASGNAVLLKPASPAVAVAMELHRLIAPWLPDGLFQILPGGSATAKAILAASDVVSFTGSTEVGRQLIRTCADVGIPVQSEMGGSNATVVLGDADCARTAAECADAAMGFAGQKCTATRRVIVIGDAGEFTDALVAAIRALRIGDPFEPDTDIGPVVSAESARTVRDTRDAAQRAGGRVLVGLDDLEANGGYVVAPVLVADPADHDPLLHEEVFGPIAAICPARDIDDAVRQVNSVRYGLVTSVYGTDLSDVLAVVDRVDTGLVRVNAPTTGVDFHAPFGGQKDSSAGPREQGKYARDFYSYVRTITLSSS